MQGCCGMGGGGGGKSPSVVDVVEIFVFAAVVVHVVGAVEF